MRLAAHRATTAQRERILELAEILAAFDGDDAQEFGDLLKQTHTLIVDAAHNEFISLSMAPLQGLSGGSGSRTCATRRPNCGEATDLHGQILRAICHGDETKATEASLRLNDFTYRTLRHQ